MRTFFFLALLGEADILTGQVFCPRSPADSLALFAGANVSAKDWIIDGVCAYVPQVCCEFDTDATVLF